MSDMACYWLSYGGGVNSTALAILMIQGRFPQYDPWRIVFSDTGDEKPETYAYIRDHFAPWLARHGKQLEIVKPTETVLERWERLKVTGSRTIRSCTENGKIIPIRDYVKNNGGGIQLIGIDAGEAHRMPDSIRPLVDADIDRDECEAIIKAAGLPSPWKSGCWHCPFARVSEVIRLAKTDPCRFERIAKLEDAATAEHGPQPDGSPRSQWGDKPASYWRERAKQGDLFYDDGGIVDSDPHCGCYDG